MLLVKLLLVKLPSFAHASVFCKCQSSLVPASRPPLMSQCFLSKWMKSSLFSLFELSYWNSKKTLYSGHVKYSWHGNFSPILSRASLKHAFWSSNKTSFSKCVIPAYFKCTFISPFAVMSCPIYADLEYVYLINRGIKNEMVRWINKIKYINCLWF